MQVTTKTKGQIEAEITTAITQFVREYLGRGPLEARTFIVQDMALVRVRVALIPAEENLAAAPGGIDLIKQLRARMIESSRALLEQLILERTGLNVISLHSDMSVPRGERVFVLIFDENIEEQIRGQR